jgi:hypothetical protein
MSGRRRLVIFGMMGRCPYGGQTWVYLNWLSCLRNLGHEVYYVEDDTVWPYNPAMDAVTDDCAYAAQHLSSSLARIGLPDRWAYRLADRKGACWGLSETQLRELYRSCDAILNIAGAVTLRDEHMAAPLRVYLESDPVASQVRLANGDARTAAAFDAHHVLASYGENYGAPDCLVPLCGRRWVTTRQPVDLKLWPVAWTPEADCFTTIGNYRQSDNDVTYEGVTYRWSKHYEWEKVMTLPQRTPQRFRLAMMPPDREDAERLRAHGWELASPLEMSLDVFGAYPSFIRGSRGEFTVAKDQNIRMRSGWFSDRAATYLASGKPVVTQDTAFDVSLPVGEGLFAFETLDEAVAAIDAINADYARHCRAARRIAEEFLDGPRVVPPFLQAVGLG